MFPRIKKLKKKNTTYEYLVISESIRSKGQESTTKDIASLGNIQKFRNKDINNLIDGFIKIFQLEKYALSDEIEIEDSLEHGSIIFWQKIWEDLKLSSMITKHISKKNSRINIGAEKYIQMMTLNRCITPFSKLGASRWKTRTCYKEMKGYKYLSNEINNYYRSMDYLLKIKTELELSIYKKLQNLFSINVKMTFYDITSTYFYSDSCPLNAKGYSRDSRPDREQIVVGVVTSYEGYPICHYIFQGNTKDEKTVEEVVKELKKRFNIEETTFVGDRGMITKLNLNKIESAGYKYIMGVKGRQDEICQMLFNDNEVNKKYEEEYRGLKIRERKIKIKEFLMWKIKLMLKEKNVTPVSKLVLLEDLINGLTNKEDLDYKKIKPVIEQIIPNEESKFYQKVFLAIKKYTGKYEDTLRYIICLNEDRKQTTQENREKNITKVSEELKRIFSAKNHNKEIMKNEESLNKLFEGYKRKYKKYFKIERDRNQKAVGHTLKDEVKKKEEKLDGIFIILTSRNDIDIVKVVESYKNLKEVESLFDDFKNYVDVRPVRHRLEIRVRAHVFICILSLLLKRILEINYMKGKAVTEPLEEISKCKLVKYKIKYSEKEDRNRSFYKVTKITPMQQKYFNMIGIKQPMNIESYI